MSNNVARKSKRAAGQRTRNAQLNVAYKRLRRKEVTRTQSGYARLSVPLDSRQTVDKQLSIRAGAIIRMKLTGDNEK